MQWFFCFFLISGFCSMVYQVVWLRMSMAGFGVTTTSVAIFLSGLISLAMKVVWMRLYMPVFGPVVYTFAAILATYLLTTAVGAQIYRNCRKRGYELSDASLTILVEGVSVTALLSLIATDVRTALNGGYIAGGVRVVFGIGPFCGLLGFMTPALLDRVFAGDPKKVGNGYALNMFGCIAGPVVA